MLVYFSNDHNINGQNNYSKISLPYQLFVNEHHNVERTETGSLSWIIIDYISCSSLRILPKNTRLFGHGNFLKSYAIFKFLAAYDSLLHNFQSNSMHSLNRLQLSIGKPCIKFMKSDIVPQGWSWMECKYFTLNSSAEFPL